jgi:CheY-like chemotaxis protein
MLPELDGLAICRAVKSEPALRYIFIAVLTARSQEKDRENARTAGADLYITKPFKAKTILQTVNQAFGPA